jgi:glucose/arabinose dehydrogenase
MFAGDPRGVRHLGLVLLGAIAVACGSPSPTPPASADAGTSSAPSPTAETTQPPAAGSATPTTGSDAFDPGSVALEVEAVVDGLDQPIDVASPGDGSGRVFVVEQAGRIRTIADGRLVSDPFLDIRGRISSGGERGLLGLAFHPEFPADPRLFVNYTDRDGDTVVAEYQLDGTGDAADPQSERVLIQIDQPYPNHNGGAVVFGPDGMLYVSTGDGGSGGDPHGNGQRLDTLLGKILRIDVDGTPEDGSAYRIPDDNPFLEMADARPEIWFTGLRNPWRMRFDGATGDLWIGDVGQGAWEEIDVARAGEGGLNFGWNRLEGFECFEPRSGCNETGFTPPVAAYGHDFGCAVIGGVVVRDPDQPLLDGGYVFSDSCSGILWVLDAGDTDRQEPTIVAESNRSISSIELDEDGTVLATDRGSGELVRILAAPR